MKDNVIWVDFKRGYRQPSIDELLGPLSIRKCMARRIRRAPKKNRNQNQGVVLAFYKKD